MDYLIEIRRRTIYILAFFIFVFIFSFIKSNILLNLIILPLSDILTSIDGFLVATEITAPIITPINIALDVSLLITIPFLMFQVLQFILPALYKEERHNIYFFIMASCVLFILGLVFCYFIFLPAVFALIVGILPSSINFMPDLTFALNFILRMLLIFGLCFQLPLLTYILVYFNVVTHRQLKLFRPYFIVIAFIVGMLLTPPDVFSQIMLALPLLVLYEVSVYFVKKL